MELFQLEIAFALFQFVIESRSGEIVHIFSFKVPHEVNNFPVVDELVAVNYTSQLFECELLFRLDFSVVEGCLDYRLDA